MFERTVGARIIRCGVMLVILGLLGCASAPDMRRTAESGAGPYEIVASARHVHIEVAADRAGLSAQRRVSLPVVRIAEDANVAGISAAQQALLANVVARAACLQLARSFEISAEDDGADVQITVELTAIRRSSGFASAVSAAAGFFVPGPARLPVGLGGLAARAEVRRGHAGTAPPLLEYRWSRGARVLAEDPSVSVIGDAWQLASALGRDLGRELQNARAPREARLPTLEKAAIAAGRAVCAERFGADPWLRRGLGKLLPLAPEAMDDVPDPD